MGDVSIIARRLSDKYIQYGWSGNGGYFRYTGNTLLNYYDDPDLVEYLFGLGQVSSLWEPYSEETDRVFKTRPTGQAHWVGNSERWMFSKIAFIDYGYFYDSDNIWYYVEPGPFRIKMPLTLVAQNLSEENGYEFEFLTGVEHMVIDRIVNHWYRTSEDFRAYLLGKGYDKEKVVEMAAKLAAENHPVYRLFDWYKPVFDYFDDWIVVRATEDGAEVKEIVMRKKEKPHVETIFWDEGM